MKTTKWLDLRKGEFFRPYFKIIVFCSIKADTPLDQLTHPSETFNTFINNTHLQLKLLSLFKYTILMKTTSLPLKNVNYHNKKCHFNSKLLFNNTIPFI